MRSKFTVPLLSAGLLATVAFAPAPALAQASKCQSVQFGEATLARFPRIREVCLDVITRDGQEYAVVKGDLVRVSSRTARIRPKMPDGSHEAARDIPIQSGRKVMVDGKAVAPTNLAVGQELTFYVKVTEPVAALEPADSEPLAAMPLPEPAAEPAPEPAMPTTASPLPLIGLGGLTLLALGGGLSLVRRRKF